MQEKKLIIFIDSGDTIINEETEVRDEHDVVVKGDCIPGADRMLKTLHEQGYKIAIVADGMYQSFQNLFSRNHIAESFDALVCSEVVGVTKPHPLMFYVAMKELGLDLDDVRRIVMVGNNLERDIRGANNMGIVSVQLNWSPRYSKTSSRKEDIPDYVIKNPMELVGLADKLNSLL